MVISFGAIPVLPLDLKSTSTDIVLAMSALSKPLKVDQFSLPHGTAGRLVGRVMAIGNLDMQRAVARHLRCAATDRILDVGCGPGVGVRTLARRAPEGSVAGIDPSETMLAQARRRNRSAIRAGRVELSRQSVPGLSFDANTFDAVASLNNVMLWEPLDEGMRDVYRVLRDGGRLAIAVHDWVVPEPRASYPARVVESLEAAGFTGVRTWRTRNLSGGAFYFLAQRGYGHRERRAGD
jgi:SAM-dependent methyltransferase